MSDIFISYARTNEPLAKQAGEALRAAGYAVWRDDELPAHRAYSEVIEERIKSAKAVLVLWSNDAVKSQWVRAEADAARELGTLVQVSLDGVLPPMPFNQIQCADLFGWTGDTGWQGWQKVVSSIASLAGAARPAAEPAPSREPARRVVICVLPFVNMSGDAEQEYFSDGISEDIITDLSKVSALTIIGRNTAFSLKGKPVDMHVLSGDLGSLFTLPGGDVGFAVGAEYRKEKSRFTPDPIAARGLTFTNALAVDEGRFNVKEVFGELRIPILADRPFAHRLEIGGAARYSDYSTIGSTTTWKVDGSYAPVRDITFNGTYSKAVRAPNIGELFAGQSQTFEFITDPCNFNQIQNGSAFRAENCQALLTSLGVDDPSSFRDERSSNIPGFQGGNPDLSEEEATTWTAGAVLQPRFVPGLTVRADWYDIELKNAVNFVEPEQLAELCVDQASLDNSFCDSIDRQNGGENAGIITGFRVGPQNVARFATAGLDVNVNYRLRTDSLGTFNLNLLGNYLDKLEFIGTPGAPVTDSRGEAFAPKYQVNFDLTWQKGPVTLNYGLSWFDKTLRFTNQETEGNPDIVAPEYLYYKERWTHDLYGSIDVNDDFQFYGGVNNIFGQKPDIGANTYPVSSVGRFFYAGARVKIPSF